MQLEGVSESNVEHGYTRHTVSANVSKYLLTDYYWPAFRAAVREADAKGFMCSYNVRHIRWCTRVALTG